MSLEPIFGAKTFGANTVCTDIHPGRIDQKTGRRDGKIPRGSRCCCMVCFRSGIDGYHKLTITAKDRIKVARWKPPEEGDQWSGVIDEDAAEPKATPRPKVKLTREQWRDIQFGRKPAPPGYELDSMNRGYIQPIDPAEIKRRYA